MWEVSEIKKNLIENDAWVLRGLLAIYKRQTSDEQINHSTSHTNGIGFNRYDAEFMTSLAEQYQKKGSLTLKQLKACRKTILKYTKQLTEIANTKS
jgi:hypothetical protein